MCHRPLCLLKKWWRWLVRFPNWLILPEVGLGNLTTHGHTNRRPDHAIVATILVEHCCTLSLCYQYRDHLIGQLTTILVSHPTYIALSYEGEMLCWLVLASLPDNCWHWHTLPQGHPCQHRMCQHGQNCCHVILYTIPANVVNNVAQIIERAIFSWLPNSTTSTKDTPVRKPWPMIEIWSQVYGNTLRIKVNL